MKFINYILKIKILKNIRSIIKERNKKILLKKLKSQQLEDIKFLKNLLIKIFREPKDCFGLDFSDMKGFQIFEKVITSCNKVNYNNRETVMAYVMLHLLERYHRFQYMQLKLLGTKECYIMSNLTKKQYNNKFDYTVRILDVGTGPAPALLAFSDFYDWLKQHKDIRLEIKSDYVENSNSFRNFLHRFTEIALKEGKKYHVPFHHGKHYNIEEYSGNDKYELVIFSNFLTSSDFLKSIETHLKDILNRMTNKSIVVINGGKYNNIYDEINNYFEHNKIKYKQYRGRWETIFSNSNRIELKKSNDKTGEIVNEYYREIKQILIDKNVYQKLPKKAIQLIEEGSKLEDCSTWYLSAYRKKSYDSRLVKRKNKMRPR